MLDRHCKFRVRLGLGTVPVTAADWAAECVTSCVFRASGGAAAGQGPGGSGGPGGHQGAGGADDQAEVRPPECVTSCVFRASGGAAAGQSPGGSGGPGGHQGAGGADGQAEVRPPGSQAARVGDGTLLKRLAQTTIAGDSAVEDFFFKKTSD